MMSAYETFCCPHCNTALDSLGPVIDKIALCRCVHCGNQFLLYNLEYTCKMPDKEIQTRYNVPQRISRSECARRDFEEQREAIMRMINNPPTHPGIMGSPW